MMNEKKYDQADKFLKELDTAQDNAYIKDDPVNMSVGFVSENTWHKLHLKHCKGRKDIASRLSKLKDMPDTAVSNKD